MQGAKFGGWCAGEYINWCNPYIASDSSWVPSWDVISSHQNHLDILLLKMIILADWSGLKVLQNLEKSNQNQS